MKKPTETRFSVQTAVYKVVCTVVDAVGSSTSSYQEGDSESNSPQKDVGRL